MIGSKRRVLIGLWLSALMLLLLFGCSLAHRPLASIAVTPALAQAPLTAVGHVQSLPVYHQAALACRHKQFREAARLLEDLVASPRLSEQEKAFCRQQRLICLKDAGLLPKSTPLPSVPQPVRDADCGPRALALVCQRLGVSTSVEQLGQLAGTTAKGTSMEGLAHAANTVGLKTEGVQVSREALSEVPMPALAWVNDNHYIAVYHVQGDGDQATADIEDPNQLHEQTIAKEQLLRLCSGYLLLVHH